MRLHKEPKYRHNILPQSPPAVSPICSRTRNSCAITGPCGSLPINGYPAPVDAPLFYTTCRQEVSPSHCRSRDHTVAYFSQPPESWQCNETTGGFPSHRAASTDGPEPISNPDPDPPLQRRFPLLQTFLQNPFNRLQSIHLFLFIILTRWKTDRIVTSPKNRLKGDMTTLPLQCH